MVCKENYKTKPIHRTNWQFLYNHVRNNDLPKRLQTIPGNKVLKAPEPYFNSTKNHNAQNKSTGAGIIYNGIFPCRFPYLFLRLSGMTLRARIR
jgi:hypothetical protein